MPKPLLYDPDKVVEVYEEVKEEDGLNGLRSFVKKINNGKYRDRFTEEELPDNEDIAYSTIYRAIQKKEKQDLLGEPLAPVDVTWEGRRKEDKERKRKELEKERMRLKKEAEQVKEEREEIEKEWKKIDKKMDKMAEEWGLINELKQEEKEEKQVSETEEEQEEKRLVNEEELDEIGLEDYTEDDTEDVANSNNPMLFWIGVALLGFSAWQLMKMFRDNQKKEQEVKQKLSKHDPKGSRKKYNVIGEDYTLFGE